MRISAGLTLVLLFGAAVALVSREPQPDPRVKGAFRRAAENGWTYVHLEGAPAEIGYQHGYLLAPEIQDAHLEIKNELAHDEKKEWEFFRAAAKDMLWPRIERAGRFCVNILGEDQEELCRVMATKGADKFHGIGWSPSVNESPVLDGALAWIDCTIDAEHDAGDHVIVVGRVHDLGLEEEGKPLLFFRGGYGRFDA